MPTAISLPRCGQVVATHQQRGYTLVRETELGVVLRHGSGGVLTVLANGETRGGDKAGPGGDAPTAWWGEPTYQRPNSTI